MLNFNDLINMKKGILLLLLCVLFSCSDEKNFSPQTCSLTATGQIKSFELDSDVKYNGFYLYKFKDKEGKDYLSFLNYRSNQILFYNWETGGLERKLVLQSEGPNGVGQVSGYYVKDFGNIYVSSYAYNGLLKVDTTAQIVQRIPYGTTSNGYKVLPSYTPSSHPNTAPIFIDGKMYITQPSVERFHPIAETPLTIEIDTVERKLEGTSITYSVLNDKARKSNDLRFGRIFNDEKFIYSFFVSEDVYVSSQDSNDVKIIKVKSRYVDSPEEPQRIDEHGPRSNLEVPRYGNIIYDPYREVYYRFAYPRVELDNKINWWGKSVFGRKKFSVIILNKDLKVIGETLFPEGIYNSYVFVVAEDGLYISRDYQINFEQSEDFMTFELFSLEKKS